MQDGFKLNVWDIGGQKSIRPYWRNYFDQTDALVYVDEAKLSEIPVLCFANKCDLMNAMEEEEIEENVNPVLKGRNFKIQKCSAKTGVGLQDGMEWLVDQLNNGAD
ncbi:GTP binding protein [Aureococcus anophagefferens]|nr:GTP binding protein [Aureococcus anophagefferens]